MLGRRAEWLPIGDTSLTGVQYDRSSCLNALNSSSIYAPARNCAFPKPTSTEWAKWRQNRLPRRDNSRIPMGMQCDTSRFLNAFNSRSICAPARNCAFPTPTSPERELAEMLGRGAEWRQNVLPHADVALMEVYPATSWVPQPHQASADLQNRSHSGKRLRMIEPDSRPTITEGSQGIIRGQVARKLQFVGTTSEEAPRKVRGVREKPPGSGKWVGEIRHGKERYWLRASKTQEEAAEKLAAVKQKLRGEGVRQDVASQPASKPASQPATCYLPVPYHPPPPLLACPPLLPEPTTHRSLKRTRVEEPYDFDVQGGCVLDVEAIEEFVSSPLFLGGIDVFDMQEKVCLEMLDEATEKFELIF